MDRRQFIISSLSMLGAAVTEKIAHAALIPLSNEPTKNEILFVEKEFDNLLSFEGRATDWDPRPWTWRMFYAHKWTGDPDSKLSQDALSEIKLDFCFDENETDWQEKLERDLDTIHPESGFLSGQEDELRYRTSSTARAYYLMKEILRQLPENSRKITTDELGLWFSTDALGPLVYIDESKHELLTEIIKTLKLPIELRQI